MSILELERSKSNYFKQTGEVRRRNTEFSEVDRLLEIRQIDVRKEYMTRNSVNNLETLELDILLEKVANERDKVAFKQLFQYFAPRVKGFFQRQGSTSDRADEVVQEAMVNVWRKAHLFDSSKSRASTWIFTVARNARIDLLRKENRPEPDFLDPTFHSGNEPSPSELFERESESEKLRLILHHLPNEQQDVLRLAFFEEKAHAEIAQELGIPLGTVKSRIRLAFKRLRKELGDEE